MVTTILGPAEVGEKPVIVGCGGMKVNPAKLSLPSGVATNTLPLAPPSLTTANSCVGETSINSFAGTPPNVTLVAVFKFVPLMVMVVSGKALVGTKPVTVGAGTNVKPGREAVPPVVVTVKIPPAPPGTTA